MMTQMPRFHAKTAELQPGSAAIVWHCRGFRNETRLTDCCCCCCCCGCCCFCFPDRPAPVSTVSANRNASLKSSDRSTDRSSAVTEEIKTRTPSEQTATESSVPEDIPSVSRNLTDSKSRDSSIPEESIRTHTRSSRSQDTSIPEDVPEEYVNDTFESLDSSTTLNHSTPMKSNLSSRREISPIVSCASSKDEENKSEEDASFTGNNKSH